MRIFNFSAGPCTLPLAALEEVQAELVDYRGAGMSMVEMSHRSAPYAEVHQGATTMARELFGVPEDFDVMFIQGGATMQFGMLPMNLLTEGTRGAYVDTGIWASKAIKDASHHGEVYTVWSGADLAYNRVPKRGELRVEDNTRYVHITSNETIGGVQYQEWPDVAVPLVADMSSDYMSRPIPWDLFDLVYGGVQKNLAPAGASLVFIRRSILEHTHRHPASYFRYAIHATTASLDPPPPVFPIYVMEKVLRWMKGQGGLLAMEAAAEQRAGLIYRTIDESGGFFTNPIDPASRSNMNVVFRIVDNDLEPKFIAEAAANGMSGLKGHSSVGGCRASVYNAMPQEGVETLCQFMMDFRQRTG